MENNWLRLALMSFAGLVIIIAILAFISPGSMMGANNMMPQAMYGQGMGTINMGGMQGMAGGYIIIPTQMGMANMPMMAGMNQGVPMMAGMNQNMPMNDNMKVMNMSGMSGMNNMSGMSNGIGAMSMQGNGRMSNVPTIIVIPLQSGPPASSSSNMSGNSAGGMSSGGGMMMM